VQSISNLQSAICNPLTFFYPSCFSFANSKCRQQILFAFWCDRSWCKQGDRFLVGYGLIAIVESLLAVARHQLPEVNEVKPEFEIFTTRLPNVFAVHSQKSRQRYEVYPDSNSCTCPHWFHRHEQEGFRDKHLEAVRAALQSGIPLLREPQTDTEKLIEKFTDEFGWIGGGQIAQARVWLESRLAIAFLLFPKCWGCIGVMTHSLHKCQCKARDQLLSPQI
jgi:hypothetical protein